MRHPLALLVFLLATPLTCARSTSRPPLARSAEECAAQSRCRIMGTLSATTDGHTYIGELKLSDGKCIDVSLPPPRLRGLLESERSIKGFVAEGSVMSYRDNDEADLTLVNGRPIGRGMCGDFYLFVAD